jgi:NADH-quinone oxidoreductase subunit K
METFSFLDVIFELFVVGLATLLLARKNFISILIALELLLLTVNLTFVYWSLVLDDFMGLIFFLVILTLAAVESVVGLALAVSFFRLQHSVLLTRFSFSKG